MIREVLASTLLAALVSSGNGHLRDRRDVLDPGHPATQTLREALQVTPDGRLVAVDQVWA